MKPWKSRPVESANLFNPAFCGDLMRWCIRTYQSEKHGPYPYSLTFLILPVIMYPDTRATMKSQSYSHLHVWLRENPQVRMTFTQRAQALLPVTRETLMFLQQVDALEINEEANCSLLRYRRKNLRGDANPIISDSYKKAAILGRWYARAGSVTNIFTMWGVRP